MRCHNLARISLNGWYFLFHFASRFGKLTHFIARVGFQGLNNRLTSRREKCLEGATLIKRFESRRSCSFEMKINLGAEIYREAFPELLFDKSPKRRRRMLVRALNLRGSLLNKWVHSLVMSAWVWRRLFNERLKVIEDWILKFNGKLSWVRMRA